MVTSAGQPVEHARVALIDGSEGVFTDLKGNFHLEDAEPPVELAVSHPRFEIERVSVEGGKPVQVILEPKQAIYEEIAVSANRGEDNFSPVSIATAVVDPSASTAPPTTITEMVADAPGVAENGQGGIFQTYSIRGVSRQRVLTLVSGMRIVSERRAGVSASFVDPLLLRKVDILRGPSSTYYGSGALGGVVQLFPQEFEGWSLRAGYASQGDESYQALGWGGGGWSLGLAHRRAGQAETPGGEELNSGFTQTSTTLQKSWSAAGFEYRLQAVASAGRDIGKSNTDFPGRRTDYPAEHHLLVRFALRSEADWSFEAWIHPNELDTRVTEPGAGRTELNNRAFDLGLNWQKEVRAGATGSLRVGADYFGRRGVEATEVAFDSPGAQTSRQKTLDGGQEDELGVYGAVEWNRGRAVILAGGRLVWQRQQNAEQASTDATAATGFVGLVLPLGQGFEFTANLGSGLRFASLSERFFTGVTGRGFVAGNPDLDSERSLNTDVGLRWYGHKLFVAGYLFRNKIDDYIERVENELDRLTFVNLTSGRLEGLELESSYQIDPSWSLFSGAHLLEGEGDAGGSLADVPADRLFLGSRWQRGRWGWQARWEGRREKTAVGSGEKAIPAASVVSASLRCDWREDLSLTLSARNLFDQEYFSTADRKVPLAPGRSLALGISWRRQPRP